MRNAVRVLLAVALCTSIVGVFLTQEVNATESADVPEGLGLSARCPGDVGIENDRAVLLYEGFEDTPKTVGWMQEGGWFGGAGFGPDKGQVLTDVGPAGGRRCVEYHIKTGRKSAASGMFHKIPPQDTVFIRTYRKFEENWEWPDGYGPHDLGIHGYLGELSGGPTDTDIHVLLDFWKTGDTVVRVGTPKQEIQNWGQFIRQNYGPPPMGYNGFPWNVSPPDKIVPGKWFCVETMAKMNTPGKEDGVVKLWVNGKLVTDVPNLMLRDDDHPDIKFDMWFLGPYNHPGVPKTQKSYVDAIVISTGPVGPLPDDQKSPFLRQQEAKGSAKE